MNRLLRMPGIRRCMLALLAGLGLSGPAFAEPLGTGFTYQGKLTDSGVAFTGTVDLIFELWSSDVGGGGIQIGGSDTVLGRPVVDGLFTATVNDNDEFEADAFNGDARWLQVSIRDADVGGAYTPLASRQPITPGPYALFAADGAGSAPSLWELNGDDVYYDSGSVGIGKDNPAAKLDIAAAGDGAELLRLSTDRPWVFRQSGAASANTSLDLHSLVNGKTFKITNRAGETVAAFRAQEGANRVGIGTTSPDYGRLEVQQASDAHNQGIAVTNTNNNSMRLWVDGTNVRRIEAGQDGTEKLTLNSGGGNVGIGPVPPQQALHISRLGGAALLLDADTNNNDVSHPQVLFRQDSESNGSRMSIRQGTDAFEIVNERPADLHFATNGTDRLTIKDDGSVGIGTTEPGGALDVVGSIRAIRGADPDQFIQISSAGASGHWLIARTRESNKKTLNIQSTHDGSGSPGGEAQIRFRVGAHSAPTEAMRIRESGRIGIGTGSPSARLHVADGTNIPSDPDLDSYVPFKIRGASTGLLFDTNQIESVGGPLHLNLRATGGTGNDVIIAAGGGNVGIGTTNPEAKLHIGGPAGSAIRSWMNNGVIVGKAGDNDGGYFGLKDEGANRQDTVVAWGDDASDALRFIHTRTGGEENGTEAMRIAGNGNVGIGTPSPQEALHVSGSLLLSRSNIFFDVAEGSYSANAITLRNFDADETVRIDAGDEVNTGGSISLSAPDGGPGASVNAHNLSGGTMTLWDGAGRPSVQLRGNYNNTGSSRIITDVLELRGADLSERFDVSSGETAAEPGMVVSIDPLNPGKLAVTREAYDKKVAGIISGAGGVRTGLVMGQKGTIADGEYAVALTGRVWCYVDAGFGAIEPGDQLTTSSTPGHAMKASQHDRARGAVIGKAMTGLESGKGMVLVLVQPQ